MPALYQNSLFHAVHPVKFGRENVKFFPQSNHDVMFLLFDVKFGLEKREKHGTIAS